MHKCVFRTTVAALSAGAMAALSVLIRRARGENKSRSMAAQDMHGNVACSVSDEDTVNYFVAIKSTATTNSNTYLCLDNHLVIFIIYMFYIHLLPNEGLHMLNLPNEVQ